MNNEINAESFVSRAKTCEHIIKVGRAIREKERANRVLKTLLTIYLIYIKNIRKIYLNIFLLYLYYILAGTGARAGAGGEGA